MGLLIEIVGTIQGGKEVSRSISNLQKNGRGEGGKGGERSPLQTYLGRKRGNKNSFFVKRESLLALGREKKKKKFLIH